MEAGTRGDSGVSEVVAAELAPLLTATPEPQNRRRHADSRREGGCRSGSTSGAHRRAYRGRMVVRVPPGGCLRSGRAESGGGCGRLRGLAAASTAGLSGKDLAAMAELQAERERPGSASPRDP
jgi:hypothetical protein